ncbi:hypothetical protein Y032_0004g1952 [Ancylostoma ceylanicum]|uniref:Uncharacterized protein n=1 Tax=Ancylostoma ceylanicum TaxID=53326 RepID=A0A016VWI2_9BILA|nr:hypothetical protein Y032_0004g1952 [Ancylostoma ceylanicum]
MPIRLKSKVYRTVVRPVALYGTECWAAKAYFRARDCSNVEMDMWYLIAFLVCLDVVHAHVQCRCPQRKPTDPVPDFVITAKIVKDEGFENGFKKYGIRGTRVLKPSDRTDFDSTIYTLSETTVFFNVTLKGRSRYLLEGMIKIE